MSLKDLLFKTVIVQPELWESIKEYYNLIQDPQYDYLCETPEKFQLDFKEACIDTVNRFTKGTDLILKRDPNNKQLLVYQHYIFDNLTFYLNWHAFISTIEMLGKPHQVQYWSKLVYDIRILGGYAQTEISHGSNVQKLETTAIYDQTTDSFIINMPSASSYKCWPGMLGLYGTHVVLQAQTTVNDKKIGLQTFVIPFRDPKTYKPYPGVDVGDIGAKLNFLRADNGYLGLSHYKIPRDYMLMKFIEVTSEGKVIEQSKDAIKFGYGSMLNLRVQMPYAFCLSGIVSSSLVYNWIRNDIEVNPNSFQNKTKQFKLVRSYVINLSMIFANRQVKSLFAQYNEQMKTMDKQINQTLTTVHIYSSSFKAISGWEAIRSTQESIMMCPFGHLNLAFQIINYADSVPYATYEGDNNVLLQQSAKYLMKEFQSLMSKKPARGIAEYFNKYIGGKREKIVLSSEVDYRNAGLIEEILERYAFEYCKETLKVFSNHMMKEGHSLNKTWNELSQTELIRMSTIFAYCNIYRLFRKELDENLVTMVNIETQKLLRKLLLLYGLFMILEHRVQIQAFQIVDIDQIELMDQMFSFIGNQIAFLDACYNGALLIKHRRFIDLDLTKLNLNPILERAKL